MLLPLLLLHNLKCLLRSIVRTSERERAYKQRKVKENNDKKATEDP
jgi:hypothetical protein